MLTSHFSDKASNMKHQINSIVGKNCITLDDGQLIYNLIHPQLLAGNSVELDFAGVDIFASPFLNAAIGQLLKDIPTETLNRLLILSNFNELGENLAKKIIKNAKEYYSNETIRKAVNEVLRQEAARV